MYGRGQRRGVGPVRPQVEDYDADVDPQVADVAVIAGDPARIEMDNGMKHFYRIAINPFARHRRINMGHSTSDQHDQKPDPLIINSNFVKTF